jgi:hypothetical protein
VNGSGVHGSGVQGSGVRGSGGEGYIQRKGLRAHPHVPDSHERTQDALQRPRPELQQPTDTGVPRTRNTRKPRLHVYGTCAHLSRKGPSFWAVLARRTTTPVGGRAAAGTSVDGEHPKSSKLEVCAQVPCAC